MNTTSPKTVVGVSNGMLPKKYIHSNKDSFLRQLNFMDNKTVTKLR